MTVESDDEEDVVMQTSSALVSTSRVPPYGQRKGWRPSPEDFGDGGAFPECPVAQYPLGMGSKKVSMLYERLSTLTLIT